MNGNVKIRGFFKASLVLLMKHVVILCNCGDGMSRSFLTEPKTNILLIIVFLSKVLATTGGHRALLAEVTLTLVSLAYRFYLSAGTLFK